MGYTNCESEINSESDRYHHPPPASFVTKIVQYAAITHGWSTPTYETYPQKRFMGSSMKPPAEHNALALILLYPISMTT